MLATGRGELVQVDAGGTTELFVLRAADGEPGGVAVGPDGVLYVSVGRGLLAVDAGAATVVIDAADHDMGATPGAVAVAPNGDVYVADVDTNRILRLTTDGADAGEVDVVAGTGEPAPSDGPTGDGEPADEVAIGAPVGLTIDTSGTLWFLDGTTRTVRVVDDGELATVSGAGDTPLESAGTYADDGIAAGDLAFGTVDGITARPDGGVYVTDAASGAIVSLVDGVATVVAARNAGQSAADGVPMNRSSVRALGAIAADDTGAVWFRDATAVRVIDR